MRASSYASEHVEDDDDDRRCDRRGRRSRGGDSIPQEREWFQNMLWSSRYIVESVVV
jgi:hypothetical protein